MTRRLVPNAKLRDRYQKSGERIRQWKRDPKMNFPKPAAVIADREYYDEDELVAWEKQRFSSQERTDHRITRPPPARCRRQAGLVGVVERAEHVVLLSVSQGPAS